MDKTNIQKILPLTPLQSGMLFHELYDPTGRAYMEQSFHEIQRELNQHAFLKSLQWLVDRHEALRIVFVYQKLSEPRQVILKKRSADFVFVDLSELPEDQQEAKRKALYLADRERGFDLAKEPLLRVTLIRMGHGRHWVLWTHHHIILDGWCRAILLKEFFLAYEHFIQGSEPAIPAARGYSAFLEWFRDHPKENAAHFWKQQMMGHSSLSSLPFTSRKDGRWKGQQQRHEFDIDSQHVEAIKAMCMSKGVTVSSFCQVLWAMLLGRYTDRDDVVFGLLVSGRPPHLEEVESMVGLFINTLPLRVKLRHGVPFWDVVLETQQVMAEMGENATVGLDEIRRLADVDHELFDHIVNFENYPVELDGGSPTGPSGWLGQTEKFENTTYAFNLAWRFRRDELSCIFLFDTLEQPEIIHALQGHIKTAIEQLVNHPELKLGEVGILPESETKSLLEEWGRGETSTPVEDTVVDQFCKVAAENENAVAIVFGDRQWTYGELDQRSTSFAQAILKAGVVPGDRVGIQLPVSEWQMIGMLGIWKAGATYVPLAPSLPPERRKQILEQASARLLVSTQEEGHLSCPQVLLEDLISIAPLGVAKHARHPLDEAYLIFTSGSTGTPKGISVSHRALVNRMIYFRDYLEIIPDDKVLQFATLSFDVSLFESLPCWLGGASLVLVPDDVRHDTAKFCHYLNAHKVSKVTFPPAFLRALDRHPLPTVSQIVSTGESAVIELAQFYAATKQFLNGYGPSEACIGATFHAVEASRDYLAEGGVSIGTPFADTRVYVLDRKLRLQPVGIPGEIYISSPFLATGYIGDSELTARCFQENPFSSEPGYNRMYKTGDLARWNFSGELEFLGRSDDQVQLNGIRVELEEIEQNIRSLTGVEEAAVLIHEHEAHHQLIAFVVLSAGTELDAERMKKALRQRLPAYMIPGRWLSGLTLPLNVNGKVDKKELREQLSLAGMEAEKHAEPLDAQQQLLAEVWSEVLQKKNLSIRANFFALGGDSIKAIRVMSSLGKKGLRIELNRLYSHPTIEELAPLLEKAEVTLAKPKTSKARNELPLSPIQSWFFRNITTHPEHWNFVDRMQTGQRLSVQDLQGALEAVMEHHEQLRAVFRQKEEGWKQCILPVSELKPEVQVWDANENDMPLHHWIDHLQSSFKLHEGPLLKLACIRGEQGDDLVLLAHHLIVDLVSWELLREDMLSVYMNLKAKNQFQLPVHTASFAQWMEAVQNHVEAGADTANDFWESHRQKTEKRNQQTKKSRPYLEKNKREVRFRIGEEATDKLFRISNSLGGYTGMQPMLLFAAGEAFAKYNAENALPIMVETHGREFKGLSLDVSRTVGWFTSMFPFLVEPNAKQAFESTYSAHLQRWVEASSRGGEFMLAANQSDHESHHFPAVLFNYLGDLRRDSNQAYRKNENLDGNYMGLSRHPDGERPFAWEVTAGLLSEGLEVVLRYDRMETKEEAVNDLRQQLERSILSFLELNTKDPSFQALSQESNRAPFGSIVWMNKNTEGMPLLLLPNSLGQSVVYAQLIRELDYDGPVWGFDLPSHRDWQGQGGISFVTDQLEKHLLESVPQKRIATLGHSLGALMAFELCKGLEAKGWVVACFNIDQPPVLAELQERIGIDAMLTGQAADLEQKLQFMDEEGREQFKRAYMRNRQLGRNHTTRGSLKSDFIALEASARQTISMEKWSDFLLGQATILQLGGDHFSILRPPLVVKVADVVREGLSKLKVQDVQSIVG